jgi:FtsH-binding integral membrane protein
MSYPIAYGEQAEVRQRSVISGAYLWMTVGLAVTGLVSLFTVSSPSMQKLMNDHVIIFFGILVVEIILVIILAAAIMRLPTGVATTLFIVYAALNGVTLSGIFYAYTLSSLASTFFVTAGTFGVMGFYGYTTKRDLTRIGNLALMALLGVILATVVNFFLQNAILYWITTYLGVLIFVALIAYDNQKLKRMNAAAGGDSARRLSILGALMLYLDFINLFLFLLRIFGGGRD